MAAAVGILTATSGFTCHATVVPRATNKPCVVGRDAKTWTDSGLQVFARGQAVDIYPGDVVSIDGDTGRVWLGIVPRQGVGAARMNTSVLPDWASLRRMRRRCSG